jgi:hypothetical protein
MSLFTILQKARGNNTDRRHYLSTNDVRQKKAAQNQLRGFFGKYPNDLTHTTTLDEVDDCQQDDCSDKRDDQTG